ncbi:glycogen synthase, partial [Pseudoxanthomonas sp. SGD-10]
CYPVAKVGGLGDVVGALPKYQVLEGVDALVAIPFYDRKFTREKSFEILFTSTIFLAEKELPYQILKENTNALGFELILVKIPGLLDREEVYCYPDENEQFIAYQLAVLDWMVKQNIKIDILHCHDHHSGLVPYLVKYSGKFNSLRNIPTVCTIHNGQYQGWMSWNDFRYIPEPEEEHNGMLDWSGTINKLAASVKCCWAYTTVSPGYLEELRHNSNGLEFLFEIEKGKGIGILNGIDPDIWNPETDAMIVANYKTNTVNRGKQTNKAFICKQFNLDKNKPLFAFIGRLVHEKGVDKLLEAVKEILVGENPDVNFLILGSGEKHLEEELVHIKDSYPNINIFIGYNEELSHKIYAAADFIVMPSRVEPCGLNQLYALKYGTVPVVRSTGGLKDSIIDIQNGGYGIRFDNCESWDIVNAIGRAKQLYSNKAQLKNIRKVMMGLDFSWNKSAQQYINLYNRLIETA